MILNVLPWCRLIPWNIIAKAWVGPVSQASPVNPDSRVTSGKAVREALAEPGVDPVSRASPVNPDSPAASEKAGPGAQAMPEVQAVLEVQVVPEVRGGPVAALTASAMR
ncbi:hypothetical protein [Methylobacterium sp. E-066]|uniref:hypothetical protein n=1 Tax=Methylobacterium sp. E-066 TaxID=2836584 RepID=UPI001FB9E251|nr:hypothetical protein [Methylobacterium sp. E-066]MCJ2143022.1 hypothetical protein [Methylobacterium sp. E-066]